MWLSLSGIAEGSDEVFQKELFNFLNMPEDSCTRQQFYKLATSRFISTDDVHFTNKRQLLLNEGVTVKPEFKDYVTKNSLLEVVSKTTKSRKGNSALQDTVGYTGLWTSAFAGADIVKSPFYNNAGEKIGSVDLMKMKRRVRIGYGDKILSEIIELDIGKDSKYSLLIGKLKDDADVPSVVGRMTAASPKEILDSLQDTVEPIDIAIPRFTVETEYNIKTIAEGFGIKDLWTKPEATRYISDPPAFPSSYYQKVSVTFSNEGVEPAREYKSVSQPEKQFIANKPFIFVLIDKETSSGHIVGVYSVPTYKD